MGYRSDVGFACVPVIKNVVETLSEWDKEFKELLQCGDDVSVTHDGRWRFESVKWYDSYPDVQIMENIMTMCDNHAANLSYESYGFVRIGEELDDIEMKGDTYGFDLYVNRCLEI